MSIANRINEITKHLENDYINIEALVGEVSEDKNIENIAPILDTLWEELPKVIGEDTSLNLNNTKKGKTKLTLKGNTYQGGEPTPDAPQEIEVVTGENVVKVEGKNLFDKDNPNIIHKHPNGTSIETNNNFVTTYFEAKEGETYTMSSNSSLFDTWACIFFTATDPTTATTILSNTARGGTSVNYVSATAPTGTKYACFYMIFSTNQTNINSLLETIQIEKGNTATEYEPYKRQTYEVNLGRYELVGYTPVDYIESSGTQYIDTLLKLSATLDIDVEFEIVQAFAWQRIFGLINTGNIFQLQTNAGSVTSWRFNYNNTNYDIPNVTKLGKKTNFKFVSGEGLYVDDVLVLSIPEVTEHPTGSLAILRGYDRYSYIKLYNSKIWDNGILVRNLVPCYRNSDNEVGMYDLVNDVFYTNQGTGAFTYGKVIPNTSIELCKIGTYQDYFYKNNGNWYLHKEIGKYVCNSTRTNAVNDYMSGTNEVSKNGTYSLFLNDTSSDISNNTMYFSVAKYEYNSIITGNIDAQNNLSDNSFCMRQGTNDRIYFKNSAFTGKTGEEISPLLNGKTLFYVLITPTDTQITDTTLVNQLEAVWRANSYDNQTNVSQTNSSLPFIISASALEKLSS